MLRISTFIAAIACAVAVSGAVPAASRAKLAVSAKSALGAHKTKRHTATKAIARVAPDNDPLNEHEWEELGTGKYTDDILTSFSFFDNIEPTTFDVRVQHDKANPGVYRIIDPWRNYPNTAEIEEQGGELLLGDDYFIVLDARKPDFVRLLRSPLGMADAGGTTEAIGYSEAYDIDPAVDEAFDGQYDLHGVLENNVITFTDENAIGIIQDDDTEDCGYYIYNANDNGAFALYLPGSDVPVDYSVTLYSVEALCPDNDNKRHVKLGGDSRIAALRYVITDEFDDAAVASATEGTEAHIGDIVEVDFNNATAAHKYLIVAMFDDKNELQNINYGEYDVPGHDDDEWLPIGKGRMTEGFLSCLTYSPFTSEEFEVEVEENKYLAGYYRLVNPYDSWSQTATYSAGHNHRHYMYVNAYDPEDVFIEYSPLGIDVSVFGEMAISSDYYKLYTEYGRDILKMHNIHSGGTMTDKVITFSSRNDIRVLCYNLGSWYYTNRLVNPAYSDDDKAAAEAAGETYDVEPYIAGPFRLDLSSTSALHDIAVDSASDAEAEYYDIYGRRTGSKPAPGLYLRRCGNSTEKVLIR